MTDIIKPITMILGMGLLLLVASIIDIFVIVALILISVVSIVVMIKGIQKILGEEKSGKND